MKKFYFILFAILVIVSCKKTKTPAEDIAVIEVVDKYKDTINHEINAFLENYSMPNPALKDLLDFDNNPLGIIQRLDGDLINTMIRDARALSDTKSILYPSEGTNKPAYYGYAYSKGQRNISSRLNPPYGNTFHKSDAVKGTDCSGFIINLLRRAGVNITDTDVSNFENSLTTALNMDQTYNKVNVKNLGYQITSKLRVGDFILWTEGANNHMGIIAFNSVGVRILYQSNGTGSPVNAADQVNNQSVRRGIHPINFTEAAGSGYPWGTAYKVLRMESGLTISNPSNYPNTQPITGNSCGGYTICDFNCLTDDWDATLGKPKFTDANGIIYIVNGVLLENVTNIWGWNFTSCTNSSANAVLFYNPTILNGTVSGKVKVLGDFGTCSPPYGNQYFTSFKFTLINSTINGDMQTNYVGTYKLASNFLLTHQ